ncbi:hypothetical protein BDN71DRAFT_1512613 [Pleurotus eryngii]|uniref:Uncharacterized protein n=1 Tax=Pleurotus eryngii TaxID=5323 RepID=A0A9P5ZNB7_PLEER|nr:hypothetical protein BDN71DRAFT_1512613 [Pleurotus eryngii]
MSNTVLTLSTPSPISKYQIPDTIPFRLPAPARHAQARLPVSHRPPPYPFSQYPLIRRYIADQAPLQRQSSNIPTPTPPDAIRGVRLGRNGNSLRACKTSASPSKRHPSRHHVLRGPPVPAFPTPLACLPRWPSLGAQSTELHSTPIFKYKYKYKSRFIRCRYIDISQLSLAACDLRLSAFDLSRLAHDLRTALELPLPLPLYHQNDRTSAER